MTPALIPKFRFCIFYMVLALCVKNLYAQTYSDGPIELKIRVTGVKVDYHPYSNVPNDNSFAGPIMCDPFPCLYYYGGADEITIKVWARDNPDIDTQQWQGGNCLLADMPMTTGGPEVYAYTSPQIVFTHQYAGQQVPGYFDLKIQAWEDDKSSDFDLLPLSNGPVISNDCQTQDGYSRCMYEGLSCCVSYFGSCLINESDDIYCNADSFALHLDYRAAGPAGQWNSHGFIAGNCPINNYYKPQIESYWQYLNLDSLSGRIISEAGSPVNSATVKAGGSGPEQTLTGANGAYKLYLSSGRSYTITPSKNNDLNISNGISSIDVLLIRRHVLGTLLSTPYRIIAADVNNSGTVTSADALLVRSMALQMISIFPGNKLWSFVPHDFVFADPTNPFPHDTSRYYASVSSLTNQDFIGIKLGDVNNSWDPNIPKNESYAGKVILEIPEREAQPGEEIELPVVAKKFNDVSGLQFTISWNPKEMKLIEVENGSIKIDYNQQRLDEGKASVLWTQENAGSLTVKEGDELFQLRFMATGAIGAKATFEISSDVTPIEAVNGNLELLEIEIVKKDAPTQTNNSGGCAVKYFPNPFQNAFVVAFTLPDEEKIQLQIFNVVGKQVKDYAGKYDAGNHQLSIDRNEMPSGSYFVKFKSGNFERNFKIACF